MNILHKTPLLLAAGALAACSSASTSFTPAVDGTAQNLGGIYSITQNGTTTRIPAAQNPTIFNGMTAWTSSGGPHKGYVYDSSDVLAISVMDMATNETIAGISGIAATSVPTSGAASYTGGFSSTYVRADVGGVWNADGSFTTNVDFGSGAIIGSGTGATGSSLSVTGTVSGVQFNGTATYASTGYTGVATAPLTGGFYGTNTMAGVYQNADVAGIIWGVQP